MSSLPTGDVPKAEVAIVGAGVIGLAIALQLLREGRSVSVIERGEVGAGSSHGNCGTITPSHALPLAAPGMVGQALRWMLKPDAPLYVRPRWDPALWRWLARFAMRCNRRDFVATARRKAVLLKASRLLLEDLVERESLDCGFRASGLWYVYRDARGFDHACADLALLRELGIEVQVIEPSRALAEEPALRDGIAGAIDFPGDARVRPDRLVAALAQRVREAGGRIETGNAALAVDVAADGVRIATANGERHAQRIVLAAGSWSPELAARLGVRLPIQPGKGYSITYAPPAVVPRRPLVLKEPSVCVTAWDDGLRLGSTMEFSGRDTTLNAVRLDALRRGAAQFLHAPEGPAVEERWYGWRPMTWDELPIVGMVPGKPRVMLATGHGMLGVSLAAVTAQLVADLMAGRDPVVDPAPLSPARFA